jgi:hypothetical protein
LDGDEVSLIYRGAEAKMRVIKNIGVNLLFLAFSFVSMIPLCLGEGRYGKGLIETVMILLAAAITIVAPLAYGVRSFAVPVRTVAAVFVGFFVCSIVMHVTANKFEIFFDMTKGWFGAILSVTLVVLQFIYNKRNILILLGKRGDFGNKTTPPVVFG